MGCEPLEGLHVSLIYTAAALHLFSSACWRDRWGGGCGKTRGKTVGLSQSQRGSW